MKHYIIVKFRDSLYDKEGIYPELEDLFQQAMGIKGVHGVTLYPSSIQGPNRYDLMVLMDMEKETLEVFDNSEIHRKWKDEYARYIESKAIFDC